MNFRDWALMNAFQKLVTLHNAANKRNADFCVSFAYVRGLCAYTGGLNENSATDLMLQNVKELQLHTLGLNVETAKSHASFVFKELFDSKYYTVYNILRSNDSTVKCAAGFPFHNYGKVEYNTTVVCLADAVRVDEDLSAYPVFSDALEEYGYSSGGHAREFLHCRWCWMPSHIAVGLSVDERYLL